nr:unnamed protein product [Digitaria exilis]
MNSSRSLLSSPLFASSSPNFRSNASIPSSPSPSRTSVPMIHDNIGRAMTVCHYSPSLVAEGQLHGYKDTLTLKGEKALLELLLDMALDQHVDGKKLIRHETEDSDFESYLRDATSRVIYQPTLIEEDGATSESSSASIGKQAGSLDHLPPSVTQTEEVTLPAEESGTSATELDLPQLHRFVSFYFKHSDAIGKCWSATSITLYSNIKPFVRTTSVDPDHSYKELLNNGQVFIRSRRLLERRSKKRKATRGSSNDVLCSVVNSKRKDKSKKFGRVLDPDEPFKLFLRDRETTEFLTAKEEKQMFGQIQACLFFPVLNTQMHFEDGCCGLMKTFEKFNPSKGCRFPTYAYWWIRQSIKKSIFKNSRLIRLPESVFALLRKVGKARLECIMEGEQPTNVNVARRAGITIEKLAKLRAKTRKPRSMQDRVWSDDGVTYQEITEDPNVEPPELSVDRLMMRQQVHNFLGILSPREKEIIEHRFGFHDGEPKTLHVIGDMYGLSKERIRQVQNKALDKLKRSVSAQGFDVYFDLLT